jgi:uncharacterized protein (TIGR02147 family)
VLKSKSQQPESVSLERSYSIFLEPDYRTFLRSVLQAMKSKNPRYSLRAFALKLEMPAGFLSQVLSGSRNLSVANALKVAAILALKPDQTDLFLKMVEVELVTNLNFKEKLRLEIASMKEKITRISVDLQRFQTLSEWYSIPVLEMMSSPLYQTNVYQLAIDLGVSPLEVEKCLEQMTSLGFITRQVLPDQTVRYQKAESYILISSELDQLAIKQFNGYMLEKMKRALYDQSPKERYSGSETLMIDPAQLPEAAAIINQCLDDLLLLFAKGENKTHLYHAGIHLFSLKRKTLKLTPGEAL